MKTNPLDRDAMPSELGSMSRLPPLPNWLPDDIVHREDRESGTGPSKEGLDPLLARFDKLLDDVESSDEYDRCSRKVDREIAHAKRRGKWLAAMTDLKIKVTCMLPFSRRREQQKLNEKMHETVERMAKQREAARPVEGTTMPHYRSLPDLPFLRLDISPYPHWGSPQALVGTFQTDSAQQLRFSVRLQFGAKEELAVSDALPSLGSLLQHLTDSESMVQLSGELSEGTLAVTGFCISNHRDGSSQLEMLERMHHHGVENALTDAQLWLLLDALYKPLLSDEQAARYVSPPPARFRGVGALRALVIICGDAYPPDIRSWAMENLEIASGSADSSGKKHAVNALEAVLNLRWRQERVQLPDKAECHRILDEHIFGQDALKQMIITYIERLRSGGGTTGARLLLNGPPGVGKTATAKAVAAIFGKNTAWLDLSMNNDHDTLAGSSRIYENGRPGRLFNEMRKCGIDGLIVLNELDKAMRGDGAATLLTMLEDGFVDNYLETTIPTDKALIIATSNDADALPEPILSRFHRIDIPGYSHRDKAALFTSYILPKALAAAGMAPDRLQLTPAAVDEIILRYDTESGARELNRIADRLVDGCLAGSDTGTIDSKALRRMLGTPRLIPRYMPEEPGIAMAAVCRNGHLHIIPVEATVRSESTGLRIVSAMSEIQAGYVRMAYEAVCQLHPAVDNVGITLSVPEMPLLYHNDKNAIGLAAAMAISSAFFDYAIPLGLAFVGGCDAHGALYAEEASAICGAIQQAEGRVNGIFVPTGLGSVARTCLSQGGPAIYELPSYAVVEKMLHREHRNREM